jgi:Thermophilic metalloprotease (M29)
MERERRLAHPGWCVNLVATGRLREGEQVLVVVDEPLVEEGAQLLAAIADAGGRATLGLWSGDRPLDRAPPEALASAATADLLLFLLQEPLAEEGVARFQLGAAVTSRGGRAILLGFVDAALLRNELSSPAPDLAATALALQERLEGATEIRIRGRAGTDLRLRVAGRPWLSDATPLGPGEYANYPGGEIFVAPHRDGADGVLVADLTVPYTVEGLVDEPVTIRFERGRATSIEGGEAARRLRELVERAGEGADTIAELGIGLNPTIAPRGHAMLDEKAAGTAHVAIGRNTGPYCGDNEAAIHVDCIFSEPQVEADRRPIQLP